MSKTALIEAMSEAHGMTKKEAELAVDRTFATIKAMTDKGEKVVLRGFGSFQVKHSAERQARNPRTGEPIRIEACDKLKFKAF